MTVIKTNGEISSALDAFGAAAHAIGTVPKSVDFPNNDMPCFEKYKECIAQIGYCLTQYKDLTLKDTKTCKALVATLAQADKKLAQEVASQ